MVRLVVVLPDPSKEWVPRPKVWARGQKWTKCQRCRAGEAQMQDNPEGGELDPAEDVRRRCKKNSSILFCMIRLALSLKW